MSWGVKRFEQAWRLDTAR